MEKINNDIDYKLVMTRIETLMAKGSESVSVAELVEIRHLSLLAQAYEQDKYAADLLS